jgi:hypothetical protein
VGGSEGCCIAVRRCSRPPFPRVCQLSGPVSPITRTYHHAPCAGRWHRVKRVSTPVFTSPRERGAIIIHARLPLIAPQQRAVQSDRLCSARCEEYRRAVGAAPA